MINCIMNQISLTFSNDSTGKYARKEEECLHRGTNTVAEEGKSDDMVRNTKTPDLSDEQLLGEGSLGQEVVLHDYLIVASLYIDDSDQLILDSCDCHCEIVDEPLGLHVHPLR
jgi:hypothetical protein